MPRSLVVSCVCTVKFFYDWSQRNLLKGIRLKIGETSLYLKTTQSIEKIEKIAESRADPAKETCTRKLSITKTMINHLESDIFI